jgi:hypothetical protein
MAEYEHLTMSQVANKDDLIRLQREEIVRLRAILDGEPTEAMMDAGDMVCTADCHLGSQMREIWKAMAAARSH